MKKLTEDEIILNLVKYLEDKGWHIVSYSLGQKKSNDIVASKDGDKFIVEASSAWSAARDYFDRVQIKSRFANTLLKVLDDKALNPRVQFAIAHPDDSQVVKAVGHLVPFLKALDIKHFWVSVDGSVYE